MLILDKLWNGDVELAGRSMGNQPEYSQCLREMEQARQVLLADLGPDQQGLVEAFQDRMRELAAYLERDAFFAGFRAGALVMMDIWGQ